MRLGINACNYNERPAGGTNKFIGIYSHLFENFPENEYFVYEPADARVRKFFKPYPNVHYIETPMSSLSTLKRHLRGAFFWPKAFQKDKIDIFEMAYFPAVIHQRGKTLLTIHDLRYTRFPEFYSTPRRVLGNKIIREGILKADCLATISYAMKKEIEEFYSPKIPIEILTPALPMNFEGKKLDPAALDALKARLQLSRPFILSVGHLEKRKNFLTLLKAYSILVGRGIDLDLVIVGNPTDDVDRLHTFVSENQLGSRVRFFSGISDSDLGGIYQAASLFVFPSVYEGFGIPLLEAMHFDCPYVLSDIDVFKELTDGKGVYFKALDPEDLSEKISHVLHDSEIREKLRKLGLQRLQVYNYKMIAENYAALLRRMS